MLNRKVMLTAIFLISLLAISAVSANENTTDQIIGLDSTNDVGKLMSDDDYDPDDDDWEDDDWNDDDWEDEDDDYEITAKLEIVDYPESYGDNQITFKLTNVKDNSSLADIDLSVISYLPAKDDTTSSERLGADLNSNPLSFVGDIYNITKITTDKNGIAVYTIPDTIPGNFSIIAGFYVEDGASSTTTVNCNGTDVQLVLTDILWADIAMPDPICELKLSKEGSYYSNVILKATLATINNDALANETIEIRFSNGKKVNVTTNSKGVATYRIPFDVGSYWAEASPVSKKVVANSTRLDNIVISKAKVTISPSKLQTTYASGKYFQIKVTDANTKSAVANVKLTLKVYTGSKYKTVTVTTNSKGIAKYLTSSLGVGTHKVVVSLKDTKNCAGSAKTSSIKVTKSGVKITAPQQYTIFKKGPGFKVTVANKATDKGVSGIAVTAKFYTGSKYQTLTAKTNSKGVATFSTKALSKKSHKVVISTKANANYNAGSAKSSVNVLANKIVTSMIVQQGIRFIFAGSGIVGTSATVTLRDINGKTLIKPIKVYSLSHGTTVETSGSAIPIRLTYSQSFTFTFEGDSIYKPASCTYYMTVS